MYSRARTRRAEVNPTSTTARATPLDGCGSIVVAGNCRLRSGSPSAQRPTSRCARTSFGRPADESATLVNTVPPLRGPSPSTHETMNCVSRSVTLLSLTNWPYPGNRRPGRHVAGDDLGADLPALQPGLLVGHERKRRPVLDVTHHAVRVQDPDDLAIEQDGGRQRLVREHRARPAHPQSGATGDRDRRDTVYVSNRQTSAADASESRKVFFRRSRLISTVRSESVHGATTSAVNVNENV